ncbi:MAG TPA: BMP family ABC transporter substrate-binding protein [Terrimesophilobacter sp.]|nr:BMP family ABC transporter substrate-binding protein [Terrimesophilobacter sp.]
MRITSRKAALSGFATLGVAVLLAGCATAPETAPASSPAAGANDFLGCMVSDAGGFDDRSFNQLGLEGLTTAVKDLGAKEKHVQSDADTDYAPNINQLLESNCNLIVTVGFNLAAASLAAAKANPDVEFAIIDDSADATGAKDKDGKDTGDGKPDYPNIKPILFDTAQSAFLGGYAAASYSKTGVVGTFGGLPIPPVTIFMDGFVDGVNYYNTQKNKNVQVLGWDVKTQNGSFTGGFAAGQEALGAANALIDKNADVILPVGGPIYQSAAAAILDSKKDIALLGVDADLFQTDTKYQALFLTSILKGIKQGVEAVVKDAAAEKFDNSPYVGTLKNDGVGLAPFHNFQDKVDPALQGELDAIKKDIISGAIKVESPSSPK